ncbi:MAG: GTPase HflX [Oscillospiraceae bacterium]|nr:GTPase HflX [Oscillospiraceae bacterium]
MELYENKQEPEKAVLIAVDTGEYDCEISLDELEELARTAGAEVIGRMWQKKEKPDPGTYLGTGRLEELSEFCENNEAELVIADSELSPAQLRSIEKATKVRVIDRTTLILDIFADRARSNEGKLQVELAQLRYSLPRLTGQGTKLSRLGGGIGTRGPGETKLETDKRHIRRRIKSLEDSLEALEKRRGLARARREKDGVETVVIVGYTNAGKSTLMNTLTDAGVLAQDKLFATLDPTSRALTLPDGRKVMLIDTVGFIRRLPHHLVEAFKSTLEEAACAKVILNVSDASDPECPEHIRVTDELLDELGCSGKPIIPVYNKCDLLPEGASMFFESDAVAISAIDGRGLDKLLAAIQKALPPTRARAKMLIPYSDGSAASALRKDSVIIAEEYRENGLYFELIADAAMIDRYQSYCVE